MKVLIVKMSSMGDILHTLPALTDASKIYSNITFDWVVEQAFAEIPAWHQSVHKVIPIALRNWRSSKIRQWHDFYRVLKAEKYDFVIDAQGLIKSAIITRLANGARFGMDKRSAREPLASFFYKHKIDIARNQHAITRIRQLFAKVLNYGIPQDLPNYGLDSSIRGNDDKNIVFIHGTSRKDKCWAEENWIQLAKLIQEKGYNVKIPWSNAEEYNRAQRIAAASNNVEILPKSSLTDLKNIFAQARAIVAVDTGLGHLAAALGVPTVSLYGPTDPKLIGTISTSVTHLITKTPGMVDIDVAAVFAKLSFS